MANPSEVALSPAGRHSPSIDFFERLPYVAGVAVAILGALVLAGWYLNLPLVTAWKAGGQPMIPLTALCFVLAGASLGTAVLRSRTPTTEAVQQTLAALVATIAVLTFYEYLWGGNARFDELLFGGQLQTTAWGPPGRISLNSAASLLLYSLALLSVSHDQRKRDLRAQMFATPALFIALVAVLGYVFGVRGMYRAGVANIWARKSLFLWSCETDNKASE
jgi:hypothetical protein